MAPMQHETTTGRQRGLLPTTSGVVAGVSAVILLVVGTRWASYLGRSPVFLTDILLAFGIAHYVIGRMTVMERFLVRPAIQIPLPRPWLPSLLAGWAAARFSVGGNLGIDAIRDVVPYIYAAVAIVGWSAIQRVSDLALNRTRGLLVAALVAHAVWFFLVGVIAPGIDEKLPTLAADQGVHLLTPRNDIDTALIGLLAAILLLRLLRGGVRHRGLLLIGLVSSWAAIFSTGSRAGLIGALLANATAIMCVLTSRKLTPSRQQIIVASLLPVFALLVAILPATTIGARLAGSLGGTEAETSAVADGAAGTQRARSQAWQNLYDWTVADYGRLAIGVGFGPNFMDESGTAPLLVGPVTAQDGNIAPRSPHNYWLGTFARLGAIGLAAALLAGLGVVRRAWRARSYLADDEMMFVVTVLPLALLVPATLGVVLESPFGSVPFWWCIGASLAMTATQKTTASTPER